MTLVLVEVEKSIRNVVVNDMSIENGNFDVLSAGNPDRKGWLIGSYIEGSTPRKSNIVEVKWARHKKGLHKASGADLKSDVYTLVVLVSGRWKQIFPEESTDITLSETGDYVIYSGQKHEAEALGDTCLCIVRWKAL